MNKLLTVFAVGILAFCGLAAAERFEERPPAVAGQFYPGDPKSLVTLVDRYLSAAEPPGKGVSERLVALLVPHAGLEYSGATAAKAFRLLTSGSWDSVIVIGTAHYKELGGAAIYPGAYATPEVSVPLDAELAEALRQASPLIKFDAGAHKKEHSVEVELPFLRRRLKSFKLVAMIMNSEDLDVARKIGHAVAQAARGKRVLLIASSDQSHYPPGNIDDIVDKTTLEALKTLDPAYFWFANRLLMRRGLPNLAVSYCGEGAVEAVMTAAKELGAGEARVLSHVNSGDSAPNHDYGRVVGYAAVAFLKSDKQAPSSVLKLADVEKKALLSVARKSIKDYLSSGHEAEVPLSPTPRFNLPAAVFVTLKRKNGDLRGCIGSLAARESLIESVARNAVASAVSDTRFKPLAASELPDVSIEISVLSQPRPVRGPEEVKLGDGVIAEQGGHSGVFLPQVWEEIPKKDAFLAELCGQKAGLPRDCYKDPATRLKVFSVDLFEEGR